METNLLIIFCMVPAGAWVLMFIWSLLAAAASADERMRDGEQ